MLTEIAAGLGSLKAAKDIVQGLNAANLQSSINDVKIDLQGHILDAQQALFAAQEKQSTMIGCIADLERQIVQLKHWERESERYELADTGQGSLAYRIKEGMENGEPTHWLCPHCYEKGRKSILMQDMIPHGAVETLNCHPCGLEIVTMGRRASPRAGSYARALGR